MGAGVSVGSACDGHEIPGCDLRLPESKITFNTNQLRGLNRHFSAMVRNNENSYMTTELESTIEGLVQRLIDSVGKVDARFKCEHIVALHRERRIRSRSLEYLITLDSMPVLDSTEECQFMEDPPGFGKVRLSGRLARIWEEFLTPGGFLAREKLVEKWLELLASRGSAAVRGKSWTPGRVLSARSALMAQPGEYCYLETSLPPKSPHEYRLAIVESACWICLRLSDLPFGTGEAKLMLGLRGKGPVGGELILPLNHPMALVHNEAAQMDWYLTASGSPKGGVWTVRRAAMECSISRHYSSYSGPARVASTINAIVDHLRSDAVKLPIWIVSKRLVERIFHERLVNARYTMKDWAQLNVAHHVLSCLDQLLTVCRRNSQDEACNIWRGGEAARRGALRGWKGDAHTLAAYIHGLHALTLKNVPKLLSESIELTLIRRWEGMIREVLLSTRTTLAEQPHYNMGQYQYIWTVISVLLSSRSGSQQNKTSVSTFRTNLLTLTSNTREPLEDFIYITALILDQAKEIYLQQNLKQNDHYNVKLSKKIKKLKEYYAISSSCLLDAIRRNILIKNINLNDNMEFVKNLLEWLYWAAKDDKKYMGPVLIPFLRQLHTISIQNCWFLDEYYGYKCEEEFEGLKEFCMEVNCGRLDSTRGLLEAAKKYLWAKTLVDFADRYKYTGLKLVFPQEDGTKSRYPLIIGPGKYTMSLKLSRTDKEEAKLRLARRCVMNAFIAAFDGEFDRINPKIQDYPTTKSDDILLKAKDGIYWRNDTKPDVVTSNLHLDKIEINGNNTKISIEQEKTVRKTKTRKDRPKTTYDFPNLGVNSMSLKNKYHTVKNLVMNERAEDFKEDLKSGSKSASSTLRHKGTMSKPSILETLDFINGIRDEIYVADSSCSETEDTNGCSDDTILNSRVGQLTPLAVAIRAGGSSPHQALASVLGALMTAGRFSVLQELCPLLSECSEGVLLSLHRLVKVNRNNSRKYRSLTKSEDMAEHPTDHYRPLPPDYISQEDGQTQTNKIKENKLGREVNKRLCPEELDYQPPNRFKDYQRVYTEITLEPHKPIGKIPDQNGKNPSHHNTTDKNYTGIIFKDVKKEKFSDKRSKSLGRTYLKKKEQAKSYNLSLGTKSGTRVNEVLRTLEENTSETGIDLKKRFKKTSVSGEGYKISVLTYE